MSAAYKMSADERTKELIRMREKALHDEASLLEEAMEDGIAKGIGIGREEERASIAEKMRADGVSEEIIKKYLS